MTSPRTEDERRKLMQAAFRMPSVQTMVSRKSSVTNAFVNAVIPVLPPTLEEIEEALDILGMRPGDVRCAYCADRSTEWDHLRPLVVKHRPTGYISEIANLVPACGKCNQSKGNKHWREWMLSGAPLSPTGRRVDGVAERIARLEAYEGWRSPTKIDFEAAVGREEWEQYWSLWESLIGRMRECQDVADRIRVKVAGRIRADVPKAEGQAEA